MTSLEWTELIDRLADCFEYEEKEKIIEMKRDYWLIKNLTKSFPPQPLFYGDQKTDRRKTTLLITFPKI